MSEAAINKGVAGDEWSELLRRGKISISWESSRRKKAQAALIKTQMRDPEFEARRIAGTKRANAKREDELRQFKGRYHSNHPNPPLPPMTAEELKRYRYLRSKTDRQTALSVIFEDRDREPSSRPTRQHSAGAGGG